MSDHPGSALISRRERDSRNVAIAAARAAGRPWREVAAEHGLSIRQASRAEQEALADAALREAADVEPLRLLGEVLSVQQRALAVAVGLAESAKREDTRVAAARAAGSLASGILSGAAAVGLVPNAPASWAKLRGLRESAEIILAVAADESKISEDVLLAEIMRRLEVAAPDVAGGLG